MSAKYSDLPHDAVHGKTTEACGVRDVASVCLEPSARLYNCTAFDNYPER